MRYFKATITYELNSGNQGAPQLEQILYCCSLTDFPKSEQLRELFYSLDGRDKKYINATWKQVREDDILTDEVHLI